MYIFESRYFKQTTNQIFKSEHKITIKDPLPMQWIVIGKCEAFAK